MYCKELPCRFRFVFVFISALALISSVCAAARPDALTADELRADEGLNRLLWLRVPPTRSAPQIDGTIDLEGGEWRDAISIPGMVEFRDALVPIEATTYLTWDEDYFYIAVRSGLFPGQRLRRRARSHGGAVGRDDVVEVSFDPLGRDQAEIGNYQVLLNSLGYRHDLFHSVGVAGSFWRAEGWKIESDYRIGADYWDIEIAIPVESFGMRRGNLPGDVWRFLIARNWKNITLEGRRRWTIYSSIGATGGFYYASSMVPLVLDDTAPVVQVTDIESLFGERFGFEAFFSNTTGRPVNALAVARVLPPHGRGEENTNWLQREEEPLDEVSRELSLSPGEEVAWEVAGRDLPDLEGNRRFYDLVFAVTCPDREIEYYRIQRSFRKREVTHEPTPYELPMSVSYNPVRHNIMVDCDVIDYERKDDAAGVRVEIFEPGADADQAEPLFRGEVTRRGHDEFTGMMEIPELEVGEYPVRMSLLEEQGGALERRETTIERLDEAAEFAWWKNDAGILDRPAYPHEDMQHADNTVRTTMGVYSFGGAALPEQIRMTDEDLLAAPVRLTASAGGQALELTPPSEPQFGKRTAMEAEIGGILRSAPLELSVANRMEYDGCMEITLDVRPSGGELEVDYLRLEIPFKPGRADWLWTMAQDPRGGYLMHDLSEGEGRIWDSSHCTVFGMSVGNFMPQYVVSDGFRGLLWFADNDRGWVPHDDVPATEVIRSEGETVLRFNLIGQPFTIRGDRRIVFYLLGLPGRPLMPGWRLGRRVMVSHFGDYVGDPIVRGSEPLPRDFEKAQAFMETGILYNRDGTPSGRTSGRHPQMELSPWFDSHGWFRYPTLNQRMFSYFALEGRDGAFTPTMIDQKVYLWNEYVRLTDIAGIYHDTPDRLGYSDNPSSGVAYIIPDNQPGAGLIQPGYTMAGWREYMKRIRGTWMDAGRKYPDVHMHSTHGGGPASATPFLDGRVDGEHHRLPASGNFMRAWPPSHLRAINVPSIFGNMKLWLMGYPWDGSIEDVDPLRTKQGALIVHDIWTAYSYTPLLGGRRAQTGSIYGNQPGTTREPPYGVKNPNTHNRLEAHGLNRDEVVYHAYWVQDGPARAVAADGRAADGVKVSLWHIPSQRKAYVVAANYNEEHVRDIAVEVDFQRLNMVPEDGRVLQAVDAETSDVLDVPPVISIPPLDYALLMFCTADVDPESPVRNIPLDVSEGRAERIAAELTAYGLHGPDVRRFGPEEAAEFINIERDGVEAEVFYLQEQRRALVVLRDGANGALRSSRFTMDTEHLDLMPEGTESTLTVIDMLADSTLQQTCFDQRGQVRARRHPDDEIGRVSGAVVLFSRQ